MWSLGSRQSQPSLPDSTPDVSGDCTQPRGQPAQVAAGTQSPGMSPSGPDHGFLGDPGLPGSCSLHTLFMPMHTSPQPPPAPEPSPLSSTPSRTTSPALGPLYSCLTPLREKLQHTRLPFHTHFLLLPTQALNPLGERALVYSFHTPHSTAISLRAEQVTDGSSSVDGLLERVRQVLLGLMKCPQRNQL